MLGDWGDLTTYDCIFGYFFVAEKANGMSEREMHFQRTLFWFGYIALYFISNGRNILLIVKFSSSRNLLTRINPLNLPQTSHLAPNYATNPPGS